MSFRSSASFRGSLKDLFTPAQIQHLMRVEFDRAQRYGYPLVLLLVGVDRLSQLQDLYGSELRDQVEGALVSVLRTSTRESDSLGCLLDDSIALLVPHTPAEGSAAMAKRILAGMRAISFECDGRPTRITVSIGGAHNNRKGELSFETLLEVAGEGLRVARASGGNRYVQSDLYEFFEQRRAREKAAAAPAPAPAAVASPPAALPGLDPVMAVLGDKIRELFGLGELDREILVRIEREVVASALREMNEQLERTTREHRSEAQERIELLERRIAKLSESLGMTEAELQRVMAAKSIDPGVASIYKTVQGLSATAVQAELKKTLMSKIFEANVEM
ncbi:MAG: diguanylate cyclase [Planctomycetota bacterium]|nr:diguanylate cyclase [Planctomycetota bacterium]